MSDSLKNQGLTEAEHARLREFLARGGEAAMPVDAIDGMFAALVCSPIPTGPSQWMPLIWGGAEPEWTSMEEAQEFFGLILRMWNQVARDINDGTYEMLTVVEELEDGTEIPYPHNWCQGFFDGTDVHKEYWWDISRDEVMLLLQPIADIVADEALRSGRKANLEGFRVIPESEYDDICAVIVESVCQLREYWLDHPVPQPSHKPATRSQPKVGRNDPCPCGSGKKFKQCHGAGGSVH